MRVRSDRWINRALCEPFREPDDTPGFGPRGAPKRRKASSKAFDEPAKTGPAHRDHPYLEREAPPTFDVIVCRASAPRLDLAVHPLTNYQNRRLTLPYPPKPQF